MGAECARFRHSLARIHCWIAVQAATLGRCAAAHKPAPCYNQDKRRLQFVSFGAYPNGTLGYQLIDLAQSADWNFSRGGISPALRLTCLKLGGPTNDINQAWQSQLSFRV